MYNLFLDDIRNPIDVLTYISDDVYEALKWRVVRSYDEFIQYIIDNGMPSLISLDHDLADEHYIAFQNKSDMKYRDFNEKTGYEALKWVCTHVLDNNIKIPKVKFHSQNTVGVLNMSSYLTNFLKFHPKLKPYIDI